MHQTPRRSPDVTRSVEFIRPAKGEPTFKSLLVVPIVHGGHGIGAICAHDEAVDKFTLEDETRLAELAGSIAPTIEQLAVDTFIGHTKRLKEVERFRGVAEELKRLTLDSAKLREQIVKAAES